MCDIVNEILCIAGSVGDDIQNNSYECCNNIMIWNIIIPDKDNNENISKRHVLNSWFLFKKCDSNNAFINDWVYFSCYTDENAIYPLVTYHHTADQSIFNILVIKHNMHVFYDKSIKHDNNKNKNLALHMVNSQHDRIPYLFIKL
jgi:hypothetical protein